MLKYFYLYTISIYRYTIIYYILLEKLYFFFPLEIKREKSEYSILLGMQIQKLNVYAYIHISRQVCVSS